MSRLKAILEEERDILARELRQKKSLLNILPKGCLFVRTHGTNSYLYWSRNKKEKGILRRAQMILHEKDRHLLEQLRRRKRIEVQIPLLEENLTRLNDFLSHYHVCDDASISAQLPLPYQNNYDYQGFKTPETVTSLSPNAFHPEHLVHKNSVGELFRSKGEVQISELLRNRKIAYEYEKKIDINGTWLLPDFTFRLPGSGRTVYLEFCGMMDQSDYFQDTIRKMKLFLDNGFVSGRDVLFLLESKSAGSDLETITRQLDCFLSQP